MIHYEDGTQVAPGDQVLMYSDEVPGIVEAILEPEEEMEKWEITEPSILFKSDRFGLVQESFDSFRSEPFLLVARASSSKGIEQ